MRRGQPDDPADLDAAARSPILSAAPPLDEALHHAPVVAFSHSAPAFEEGSLQARGVGKGAENESRRRDDNMSMKRPSPEVQQARLGAKAEAEAERTWQQSAAAAGRQTPDGHGAARGLALEARLSSNSNADLVRVHPTANTRDDAGDVSAGRQRLMG